MADSTNSSNSVGDGSAKDHPAMSAPSGSLNDTMEQSLKQLLVQCAGTGPFNKENVSNEMSDEDRKFIEGALESTVNRNETVNTLTSMIRTLEKLCMEHPRQPTQDELQISELLEEITEELHNGDEFIAMGGIKLCSALLDSVSPTIQEISCNIIANVASNNVTFQTHSDGNELVKRLLVAAKEATQTASKTKLLYAASCTISSNVSAIRFVIEDLELGIEHLFKLYIEDSELKSRNRTGRIIGSIFREIPASAKLDVDQVLAFARNLVDTPGYNSLLVTNLQLINCIYNSTYPGLRKQIRTELGPKLIKILQELPSDVFDSESDLISSDGKGISESLKAFQRCLETEDSIAEKSAPLAIRM